MNRSALLLAAAFLTAQASAAEAHVVVELREAGGFSLDDVEVRLTRLNDGTSGEKYCGPELVIPYDLRSCCLSMHGEKTGFRGEVRGKLSGFDDASRYSISILPIWSNGNNIAAKPDTAAEFKFFPIGLGQYVVLLMERDRVMETRVVSLTEFNPVGRADFRYGGMSGRP